MTRLAGNFAAGMTRAARGIADRMTREWSGAGTYRNTATGEYSKLLSDPYDVRDRMLAGTLYARGRGSYFTDILKTLGKPCADAAPIVNYYNPVPAIVGCYAHALGGRLGEELKLETPKGEPLPDRVTDALARVWKWSGLDTGLETFTTLSANQGTAGIQVVTQGGTSPKVYLRFIHPRDIDDAIEDSRGNVTGVRLKYAGVSDSPLGEAPDATEVIETLERDRFSLTVDNRETLTGEAAVNSLGVTPFVLNRHRRRHGDFFGRHAYEGSEHAIYSFNWALSQLDEATARAISETWFLGGAGDEPNEIEIGRMKAMYVKLAAGVPQPFAEQLVPKLAIGDVRDTIVQSIDLLLTSQPELILNNLKLLSNTSGETLLQVLRPVEAAVLKARTGYEDSIVRALQISLSAGVVMGLWDLGTGTDSREAADRAFDDGQGPEAFRFAARPALPQTPQMRIAHAQGEVAEQKEKFSLAAAAQKLINDPVEVLKHAGYSEEEATRLAAVPPPAAPAAPGQTLPIGNTGAANPRVARLLASLQ